MPFINENERDKIIGKVDSKIDKLLEINKSQIEDMEETRDDMKEIKKELANISSQFKIHAFEDATRFSAWEHKFTKEIDPILKHVNESIAFGGWIKNNQKLIIIVILAILTALGLVKGEQFLSYIQTSTDSDDKKEQVEKKE